MTTGKTVKPGQIGWNAYAAASCDTDHGMSGLADGILTQDELREHIRVLQGQINAYNADIIEPEVRDANRALRDMQLADADGVEYLPENCRSLNDRLKRRATEILLADDEDARGVLTPQLINKARQRYQNYGSVPSWVMQQSRDTAMSELDELEEALFPRR